MSLNPAQNFDRWAADYDRDVRQSDADESFPFAGYARVLDSVVGLAEARPGLSLLELGSGTGSLTARFAALGCDVLGTDFSAEMLARARLHVPAARFVQVDLLGDWPPELNRRFDRVASTYTFHEFDLPAKIQLLRRLASDHLAPDGRIVIGDIGFPDAPARDAARRQWADQWDEEFYWIADEAIPALRAAGLGASYRQISVCGCVLLITPAAA
ncbi:MAG: class I SAM-dependent methyltransferase [Chloroflexi bacterium]|nr:class I SAM-dependent methyltransferase [Chloroflexota bacterium]